MFCIERACTYLAGIILTKRGRVVSCEMAHIHFIEVINGTNAVIDVHFGGSLVSVLIALLRE